MFSSEAQATAMEARLVALLRKRCVQRTDCYLSETRKKVQEPLTDAVLLAHLHGRDRIGAYADALTKFLCLDFDGKTPKYSPKGRETALAEARRAAAVLDADLGLRPIVEVSRSGIGYHVILFFSEAELPTVEEAKQLGRQVLRAAALPDRESEANGEPGIFPHPQGPKGIGKTPFLPWGGLLAGATGGRFINVGSGEPIDGQEAAIEDAQLITRAQLALAMRKLEEAEEERPTAQAEAPNPVLVSAPRVRALNDPHAAGRARHEVLRGEVMRLRSLLPIDETRTIAFALADRYQMQDRHGEVEDLIVSAYLKAPIEIETEFQRSRRVELPADALAGMARVVARMPSYAAGSIVRDVGLHLWWSRPGNLKTYLAILLVLEMTQRKVGDLLFGVPGLQIIRPWCRVLWLGDEETAEEWKARAEAVARGHGLRPPGDEVLFADASGGPCLLNLDHLPQLLELAGPHVSAVFADPLANLGPDKDADGRPVKVDLDNVHALHRVCRPLRRLAKQREIGVFLLHHANSTGERERGPTAYRGSADVVAELKFDSDVLTLLDHKNRDRRKGRFSFRPVWEDLPSGLSVRFEPAAEPVATAARGLKGTTRAMFAAAQAGAGHLTYAELMRTKIPGKDTEDVSSKTKRRSWIELVQAGLVCEDKGVVRLLSQKKGASGDSDTSGHETDTSVL